MTYAGIVGAGGGAPRGPAVGPGPTIGVGRTCCACCADAKGVMGDATDKVTGEADTYPGNPGGAGGVPSKVRCGAACMGCTTTGRPVSGVCGDCDCDGFGIGIGMGLWGGKGSRCEAGNADADDDVGGTYGRGCCGW